MVGRKNISTIGFTVSEPFPGDGDRKEQGRFNLPKNFSWRRCEEDLEKTQDAAKTYSMYLKALQGILRREPNFLDGYAHIGGAYLDCDSVDEALVWYQKGLDIAVPLIPTNFKGRISWFELDNRPFLRLHHGYILCLLRSRQYKRAAQLMEEHLRWNKNDNIGVRFLIGDAYLQAGMTQKARKALKNGAKDYPPNAYSLGLLEFKEGQYVAAATALRHGFAGNQYIAEILTGRNAPKKHFFWHSTSNQDPDLAAGYLDSQCLKLWSETEGAVDFVDWLFNCSAVLKERAEFAEIREGLTYEHDFNTRGELVERHQNLLKKIDNSVSETLIRKVTDRYSTEHWPWQHGR